MIQQVQTADLILRPISAHDISSNYHMWLNDPNIVKYLEVRHSQQRTDADIRAFVEGCNKNPDIALVGVFDKDSGRHIGNAKLEGVTNRYGVADLGFLLGDRAFHGRKLGSQMVGGMTQIAFKQLGLRKVTAGAYHDNIASRRALLANGFVEEGFLRDHCFVDGSAVSIHLYGLLKSDI